MPFVIALAFAVVLIPPARRAAMAAGLVDHPVASELKIHDRPVPLSGGPAVVAAALGAAALYGGVPAAAVAAVLLALAVGIADDVRPLPPWIRVVGLAAAGVILAAGGIRLAPLGAAGWPATVLLVLASANAVNIMDGQDGLAGGLTMAAALGLAWLLAGGGVSGVSLALALAGALGAFLLWNRPPARIYLGNSGAYAVGALLAVLAARSSSSSGWHGLVAAALCLGVFAFEIIFTFARRMASGARLSAGDREHAYDLVARRTGSRGIVTLLLVAAGLVLVALARVAQGTTLVIGIVVAAGLALSAIAAGLVHGRRTAERATILSNTGMQKGSA